MRELGPARRVHEGCIKGERLISEGNFLAKQEDFRGRLFPGSSLEISESVREEKEGSTKTGSLKAVD